MNQIMKEIEIGSSAPKMARRVALVLLVGAAVFLTSGCRYNGNKSGLHWFLDMHDSYAVEAQEEDPTTLHMVKGKDWDQGADPISAFGGPGSAMRVPPEGTVPMNYAPYPYGPNDIVAAGEGLKNPLKPSQEVMERGKKMYDIYCAVCHGYTGKGDGPVVQPFPAPPSLVTAGAPTRVWKDGMIFHMITVGRGVMKPYAAQIDVADRWAIVNYVRLLQDSQK